MIVRIAAIAVASVVFGGALWLGFSNDEPQPKRTEEILELLAAGDYEAAYEYFSPSLQAEYVSPFGLQGVMLGSGFQPVDWDTRWPRGGSTPHVAVDVTGADGREWDGQVEFRRIAGDLRIVRFDFGPNG